MTKATERLVLLAPSLVALAIVGAIGWAAEQKAYERGRYDGVALAMRAQAFQEQWDRGEVCCYDCGTGPWRCSWMPQ